MHISLLAILTIITIHFIGDFVLQTRWQAINKSKDNWALTQHVSTYTLCWIVPMTALFYLEPFNLGGAIVLSLLFTWITFVTHWVIDYFTSRLNAKLWAKGDMYNFFVGIGGDQLLHFAQLFTTFCILKNI
jgi:hypothetical protein